MEYQVHADFFYGYEIILSDQKCEEECEYYNSKVKMLNPDLRVTSVSNDQETRFILYHKDDDMSVSIKVSEGHQIFSNHKTFKDWKGPVDEIARAMGWTLRSKSWFLGMSQG